MPPDRDINWVPDTQPISIPLYRMASTKLKELNKFQELPDKGFIKPSVPPWVSISPVADGVKGVPTSPRPLVSLSRPVDQGIRGVVNRLAQPDFPQAQNYVKVFTDTSSFEVPDSPKSWESVNQGSSVYVMGYAEEEESSLAKRRKALSNSLVKLDILESSKVLAYVVSQSSLFERIKARQFGDPHLLVLKDMVHHGGTKEVTVGDDGVWQLQGQICVPDVDGLRELILDEAHRSQYSIHPSATKMYYNLMQHYWWRMIKKDFVEYVAWCLNYQQVKYEHQRPSGLLHRLEIPEWKWECITLYFVAVFPQTMRRFDVVWVIMDRLTKSVHFILIMTSYTSEWLAKIYIMEVVCLYGMPVSIISNCGPQFISIF
nr:uncharacterized protein LOC117278694 [Nicotiana tomentosiformis]